MRKLTVMAILAAAGCATAPAEKPAVEEPERHAPAARPASKGLAEGVVGWWVAWRQGSDGPGPVRRVELIFNDDGSYEGAIVFQADGGLRLRSNRGRYLMEEEKVMIRYENGTLRTFSFRREGDALFLGDAEQELELRSVSKPGP